MTSVSPKPRFFPNRKFLLSLAIVDYSLCVKMMEEVDVKGKQVSLTQISNKFDNQKLIMFCKTWIIATRPACLRL